MMHYESTLSLNSAYSKYDFMKFRRAVWVDLFE